ncbi:glycoside hydrolase family 13 protein [Ornithinimicrobium sp. Y1847]|uniref:glycoside hydrolase family 13 protein n=1 Tax=unclassified Ornithinimicrobium TaxID=2615080 RepID=UPI003B67C29C
MTETREFYHRPHHDGSPLYCSPSRPVLGDEVTVRLRIPTDESVTVQSVHVRYLVDHEPRFVAAKVVSESEAETWWAATIQVANSVTNYRFILEGADGNYVWVNGTGSHARDVPDASDFRLVSKSAPDWVADAVVYQIFPDRFSRSDAADARDLPAWAIPADWDDDVQTVMPGVAAQLYGGDLDGVIERLAYLEGLGVNVLYLTPFFPGESNHRYDAETFGAVDPLLGGDAAMVRLAEAAHERGMRVMGDFTTNHTGVTHEWFQAAISSPDHPSRDHYYFGPEHEPLGYATWLGVPTLPKLNYASDDLRQRIFEGDGSVVERWLRPPFNLDGWRIDVANMSGRFGEWDHYNDVQRLVRESATRANADALVVAEHCHDLARDVDGTGWHGAMNYSAFTRPVWTWLRSTETAPNFLGSPLMVPRRGGVAVVETMQDFIAQVPWEVTRSSWNLLGSHDTTRITTLTGEDQQLVEVAAGLLFTMPGTPMMTYGDEVGMLGEWGEDGRRPMPWSETNEANPYFQAYTRLIHARRGSTALREGGLRWVLATEDAIVFVREHPDESVLVHLSRQAHDPISIPCSAFPGVLDGSNRLGQAPAFGEQDLVFSADGPGVNLWSWRPLLPQELQSLLTRAEVL